MKLDDALKDLLRERGADEDMLRWLEEPEAVRALLKLNARVGYDYVCEVCETDDGMAHLANCPIADAWRKLGDPRAAQDVEQAHDEALSEHLRRLATPRTPAGRFWMVSNLIRDGRISHSAAARLLQLGGE